MPRDTTRRALLGALVGAGVGGAALPPARGYLDRFAPATGRAWQSARRTLPEEVSSPHGEATVTYDDHGVPHVEAETEPAAYFAVGYLQAADRLFQMDLIRRRMDGTLSAALGEVTVEQDEFAAKMDFQEAARASEEALSGTDAHRMAVAFRDGVNAYVDSESLPLEFGLLGYEPREWRVLDTLLVGLQIAWGLTGSFGTLRRAVLRRKLDADTYERLYPSSLDHDAPIIREGETGGDVSGAAERVGEPGAAVDPDLVEWLGQFEPPRLLGSNSWVVSGEHTASGRPVVCNDPHLTLSAPPVWYEQHVSAGGVDVRGVTLPGVPFVVIGENDHGAWGFTNTGADVIDFYDYETDEARERYRYRGEWREFDTETRTVEVAGGDDREVEVKKTVHGPFLEREVDGEHRHVGVAWTGTSATRESAAVYGFSHAEGVDDFRDALRLFDVPTQNAVYADRDGNTLYEVTGKIPVRRVDGEVVRGDRVFDGSAGEGEWEGFQPYGPSSWEGFVPFDEKPGVADPDYLATANQRVIDDPAYPIGQEYASPFRGMRIYELLDGAVDRGEPMDLAFMQSVQGDSLDIRARMLVPALLDARERMPDAAGEWLDALADWDYRMDRDSKAALAFHRWYEAFREATWKEDFEALGLDDSYWPQEWVLVTLPADGEFFDGDRAAVMADAMDEAIDEIDSEGWETYGDYNVTAVDHPFGEQVPGLNYPRYPTDGSAFAVRNVRKESAVGSSWRMIAPPGGDSVGILPGGNDGSYFSEHYDDQLRAWADGEYKPLPGAVPDGAPTITFGGEDG